MLSDTHVTKLMETVKRVQKKLTSMVHELSKNSDSDSRG